MKTHKIGDRVVVPFGLESRVEGRIKRGPYPAPADFRAFQLKHYGIRVANVYDVSVGRSAPLTIAARYVARRKAVR